MDVENLAKELILKNMTPEQQMAVLDSVRSSVAQAKEVQKRKIGENVDLVVQALKKIESDIRSRFDDVGNSIEKRVASIQDGRDGADGKDGRDGKDGKNGRDGAKGDRGERGQDGIDGVDGNDGVSVSNARIDFDGSLIITLSSGIELNVGEVVSPDLAESIKVITNGGGTSQYVLDTLASLQAQITALIPSQTGNSGKFLTTNGTALSWASVAGGLSYQGTWNATTNTPTLTSSVGVNGYYYIVDTAGSTNLNGITDWQIGDWLLFNGTVWQKIDQSNLVTSVNGQTGAVSVGTVTSVAATAGTGISVSGSPITSSGTLTITNSAPDQTVALTGAGTTSISGTYPNFTITSNDAYVGTVTSVGITAGTGITVSNSPITSSGSMTVGVSTKLANFVNLSGSGLIAQNGSGALDAVTITAGTGISVAHGNGTSGDPTISLASGYGDTLNPYASKTANYFLAAPNGSAGVPTFRAIVAADIPTLNQNTTGTASNVTGTVAIANGGTGQTTATAAFDALAPSQTSNSGKYLTTNGSTTSWATVSSTGTVTSVAATVPAFLSVTGSPITTSGTLAISLSGTALPVANGGTGVTTSTGSGANVLGTSPTLTTPTIDSAQVATVSGTAPLYMARAWVNFNGTTNTAGFCTIRASGNVTSVADNGTGDYTVNFTTAMPDADYVTTGTCSGADTPTNNVATLNTKLTSGLTTSSCRLYSTNSAAAAADRAFIAVAIFR
jgi:hypothetical protein